jgi:hypothetical protein
MILYYHNKNDISNEGGYGEVDENNISSYE